MKAFFFYSKQKKTIVNGSKDRWELSLLTDYFGGFYSFIVKVFEKMNELLTWLIHSGLELSLKVGFEIDFYCFLFLFFLFTVKVKKVNKINIK